MHSVIHDFLFLYGALLFHTYFFFRGRKKGSNQDSNGSISAKWQYVVKV